MELVSESSNLLALFSKTNAIPNKDRGDQPDISRFYHPTQINTTGTIIKIINVKETALTTLLNNNLPPEQIVEFLSLDVVGFNMRTLKLLNWNRCAPLFIIVKTAAGLKDGTSAIYTLLKQKNYELVASAEHAFFFKRKGR